MFRKGFVSVHFLSDKLQVVELSSNKKKVKKFASLNLPGNLIENYEVKDTKSLAEVLKNTWSKLKIGEKSVALVIPEFSTFIKLLELPEISLSEIDEAVRWQAQEFLPTNSQDMIMDWKIAGRKGGGYEVVTVAIERDILDGYVKSAEMAGLFPLIVETPSISLSRMTEEEERATLLVYQAGSEAILLVTKGKRILASSVVQKGGAEEIKKTAKRIVSHYEDLDIKKVLLGGVLQKELGSELESALGLETAWSNLDVKGIEEAKSQEFIVPINSQLRGVEEPSDPFSLNLLPTNLVDKYKFEKLKVQLWSLTLTVTLFVWITFLAALGSYLYINQQISDMEAKVASQSHISRQRKEAVGSVERINEAADRVVKVKGVSVKPQEVLNSIEGARPQGVTINEYNLDLDVGKVDATGTASDRQSLVEFKERLEENSNIGSVEIPISSFQREVNLEFQVTFNYLPITEKSSAKK